MLLSLIAVAVQTQTVTLSFPPTPMTKALAILSGAIHQRLGASPALSEEVMVASLTDAASEQVLKNVALVFCAKWQSEADGVTYLVPDRAVRKKLDEADFKRDLAAMKHSFDYVASELAKQPAALDDKSARDFVNKLAAANISSEQRDPGLKTRVPVSLSNESPAWRSLARILPLIGADTMLQMEPFTQVDWSENPNQLQRQMPDQANDVLANYRREMALVDPNVNVAKVKVTVNRWVDGPIFLASFYARDSTGKTVDRVSIRLNNPGDLYNRPPTSEFKPQPGEAPLKISEECKDARIALSIFGKDPSQPKILQMWRPKMEDPIHREPTTWYQGADLRTAAEALGKNLIGSVSDRTTDNDWMPNQDTPSQFLAKRAADVLPSESGWLLFRDHERLARVSRSDGQALIKRSLDRGGVTVDDAAAQAAKVPNTWPYDNWLGTYLQALFAGRGPYSPLATTTGPSQLRIWNCLGESTLANLKNGATVNLVDLSTDAKARIVQYFEYGDVGKGDLDATDVLPDGITGGTLRMSVVEKPVMIGWSAKDGPPADPVPMDAQMLGKTLASGNARWQISVAAVKNWDTFRVGVYREYRLQFTIEPGSWPMTVMLSETLFDPAKQPTGRLPAAIQKEVDTARIVETSRPHPRQPEIKGAIPPR